jgi:hypothetical protein
MVQVVLAILGILMAQRGIHLVWKTWEQLIMEHELRLAEMKGRIRIPCTCRFCHAGKLLPLSAVEVHLKRDGRDPWI